MVERREWLIRKGGLFYRPDKRGYTSSKAEAGRYTEADARAEAGIEPWRMSAIHEDGVPDDLPDAEDLATELAALREQLEKERRLLASVRVDAMRADNELCAMEARAASAESSLSARDKRIAELEEGLREARNILNVAVNYIDQPTTKAATAFAVEKADALLSSKPGGAE